LLSSLFIVILVRIRPSQSDYGKPEQSGYYSERHVVNQSDRNDSGYERSVVFQPKVMMENQQD